MSSPDAAAALQALAELIDGVAQLRDPEGGCPWDLVQTHASLGPTCWRWPTRWPTGFATAMTATWQRNWGTCLQVVLHARIGSEEGRFDLEQIALGISAKLIRRHPHEFVDAEASDMPL